ncbi:MAG: hypothetical protein ACXWQE_13995 [Bdellovibrionales bacterium]
MHKLILSAVMFLPFSVSASEIDNKVAQFQNVKVITPVTYKGLPIRSDSATLCNFLGYSIALESTVRTAVAGEKFFDLVIKSSGIAISANSASVNDPYEQLFTSITCAKP